ncbi:hypothetical protein CYMTET_28023 [Cymbomonas tetramitiformis]|uniref:Uncharacterized protein n=1 Tax=Cymbomonas tetramitiformis TaxID=36881 RepID=A0AAE0FNR1_9CHLO|nr:hypothetical protein CYMTET_28023 [Cymbomonas tetramitiformis]
MLLLERLTHPRRSTTLNEVDEGTTPAIPVGNKVSDAQKKMLRRRVPLHDIREGIIQQLVDLLNDLPGGVVEGKGCQVQSSRIKLVFQDNHDLSQFLGVTGGLKVVLYAA